MAESTGPAGPQTRGRLVLLPSKCTSCMLCVRECPTWCISLEAHAVQSQPAPGARPRTELVLDEFTVDYGLCMYCGICVEVCPFDALAWSEDAEYAEPEARGLRHGIDRLDSGR